MRAIVFNDTSWTMHHGCNCVLATLADGLFKRGIEPVLFWPVGVNWAPHKAFLTAQYPDIIVVNGEGTIHHSAHRERARQLCRLSRLGAALNVPSFLINASIEAIAQEDVDDLKRFTMITVRESGSADYLRNIGIKAEVIADLSLGVEPPRPVARSGYFVTDSVFPHVQQTLRDFSRRAGLPYHGMREKPSKLLKLRRSLVRRLPTRFASRTFLPTTDYQLFLTNLSATRGVVTGRFHTMMLAILTDTPFVAVGSNTTKIEATVRDALGSTDRIVAMEDLAKANTADLVHAFSPEELSRLAAFRAYSEGARARLFGHMRDAATNARDGK